MHPFELFITDFIPKVASKSIQLNRALWLLETTGSADAADLKANLDTELRLLFNDSSTFNQLLLWDQELSDPLLKRQLNVLIRTFKQNQIPPSLLEEIAQKEAALSQSYATFRPELHGKPLSENEIHDILKKENDPFLRKEVWAASKKIGNFLAPQILDLVILRNRAAQSLGYSDYFQMQLDLQEVNREWLLQTFDTSSIASDAAYTHLLNNIEEKLSARFGVPRDQLAPWAWSDPFCQSDPLDVDLDSLVSDLDIVQISKDYYQKMNIPVQSILERSDLFERKGKNQHAFCINMDRASDVRTLNNLQPSMKWLETLLHELGHAIYELGFDPHLPWLLREPPHMITTEAMALLAGRQAYQTHFLKHLSDKESLIHQAEKSLQRRQLIFSRWVLAMTFFESELYRDPSQNLNKLWWDAVEKYQKIRPPANRQQEHDWASKYHIGLAPVYYFSYLLGEFFASAIEESLIKKIGSKDIANPQAGAFLNKKLFYPGNTLSWNRLIEEVTGAPLTSEAWLKQFAD